MASGYEKMILKQVEDAIKEETIRLATKARDLLFKEFRRIVDVFYDEYEPVEYIRHGRSGLYGGAGRNLGLHSTYKKYYKNSHGGLHGAFGGIEISNDRMANDYGVPNEIVLNTFLDGWHGPPDPWGAGPVKEGEPYKLIIKYRDKLAANLLNER